MSAFVTCILISRLKNRLTNFSGSVQLLCNVEAAKCEVNDSHCERGQSMLGTRLPLVSYR